MEIYDNYTEVHFIFFSHQSEKYIYYKKEFHVQNNFFF